MSNDGSRPQCSEKEATLRPDIFLYKQNLPELIEKFYRIVMNSLYTHKSYHFIQHPMNDNNKKWHRQNESMSGNILDCVLIILYM